MEHRCRYDDNDVPSLSFGREPELGDCGEVAGPGGIFGLVGLQEWAERESLRAE